MHWQMCNFLIACWDVTGKIHYEIITTAGKTRYKFKTMNT
jgi:hypothetical protein